MVHKKTKSWVPDPQSQRQQFQQRGAVVRTFARPPVPVQQGPRSTPPFARPPAPQGHPRPEIICFKCRRPGHKAPQCTDPRFARHPPPPPRSTPSNAMVRAQPRGARVNNVTLADSQQSSEIVLGRLLVCSVPATVLFDSRASHSFISQSFASASDLQSELLYPPCSPHSWFQMQLFRVCSRCGDHYSGCYLSSSPGCLGSFR